MLLPSHDTLIAPCIFLVARMTMAELLCNGPVTKATEGEQTNKNMGKQQVS